jgi:hypothetical protein
MILSKKRPAMKNDTDPVVSLMTEIAGYGVYALFQDLLRFPHANAKRSMHGDWQRPYSCSAHSI